MKKTLVIVSLLFIVVSLIVFSISITNEKNSNPGLHGDWSYKLPNNYEIWRINSRSIVFGEKKDTNSINILIDRYVSAFRYNDKIIALQCVDVPESLTEPIDISNPDYYIIDIANGEIYGEFSVDEYENKLSEFETNELTDWIYSVPTPEDVYY